MKTKEKLVGRVLYINTSSDKVAISLFLGDRKIDENNLDTRSELTEKLLPEIDNLLKKNKFDPELIAVYPGPGSYTGLRIGITVANFLSWTLQIPIFEANEVGKVINKKKIILPKYLQRAHITKPKNK